MEENTNLEDLLKEDVEEEELIQILLNRALQHELDIKKLKASNNEYERQLTETKEKLTTEKEALRTEIEAKENLKTELARVESERDARPDVANDKYNELTEELTKLRTENEKLRKDKELKEKLAGLKKAKRDNRMKLLAQTKEVMDKTDKVFTECKILLEIPPK